MSNMRKNLWFCFIFFSPVLHAFPLEESEPCYDHCSDPTDVIILILLSILAGFIARQLRIIYYSTYDIGLIFLEICAAAFALIAGDGKISVTLSLFIVAQAQILLIYVILKDIEKY